MKLHEGIGAFEHALGFSVVLSCCRNGRTTAVVVIVVIGIASGCILATAAIASPPSYNVSTMLLSNPNHKNRAIPRSPSLDTWPTALPPAIDTAHDPELVPLIADIAFACGSDNVFVRCAFMAGTAEGIHDSSSLGSLATHEEGSRCLNGDSAIHAGCTGRVPMEEDTLL